MPMHPPPPLINIVGKALARAAPSALDAVCDDVAARFGPAVLAVLYYGSCLRSGNPLEGVVDVHVVVSRYRDAYRLWPLALANRVLPPNVFYAEVGDPGRPLRYKCNVVSLDHLEHLTSKRAFHSFFWARFAQPTAVLWVRDEAVRDRIAVVAAQAIVTFLDRAWPVAWPDVDGTRLWRTGLALTIAAELRAESAQRVDELLSADPDWFERVTPAALAGIAPATPVAAWRKRSAAFLWRVRQLWGKLLSLLRLVKALFTFEGGLDYVAWKLARHSGRRIEVPARVRRWPWLFLPGFAWRLYREGVFR